jgi:hypothetical protein
MFDNEPDKLAKAQAMENLGGFFAGSHYSAYHMECRGDKHKYYDVFFPWSLYFVDHLYNRYAFIEIFSSGYPADFCFSKRKQRSQNLRREYQGKFILTFIDNKSDNSFPYTRRMHVTIYQMLLDLLGQRQNVVVFLKPKRKQYVDDFIRELPKLGDFIRDGRIRVFTNESARIKAVAGEIGMASDLVVGMGISTAAMECFFSGTKAFHADLNSLLTSPFIDKGLGRAVFRDVDQLKNAIIAQMEGRGVTYEELKPIYDMLDPFQDGKASRRTGFVLKELQSSLREGTSREDVLRRMRILYNKEISNLSLKKNQYV